MFISFKGVLDTKTKQIVIFVIFLFMVYPVFALDYSVQVNSPSKVNVYEGKPIENTFSAIITNNAGTCDISCDWSTSMNTLGSDSVKVEHGGKSNNFYFDLKAEGINGIASYTLTVACERIREGILCQIPGSEDWTSEPYSFTFLHNADGVCTTEREKCDNYLDFLKDPACVCSSDKQCKPDSERGSDNQGCATFCGNKKVEKQFEDCKKCPDDVGKCEGQSCSSANECEDKYCARGRCSKTQYLVGDGFCDSNVGENCRLSTKDCACSSNERCSSAGVCETYCGNGICEANEQGICADDCDWCGDGVCQEEKETCRGCSQDCGECEQTQEEEIAVKGLKEVKKEAETLAKQTQKQNLIFKTTASGTGGLVLLIIVIWIIYRVIKSKKSKSKIKPKSKEKVKKEKSDVNICKNCKSENSKSAKFCNNCGKKLK